MQHRQGSKDELQKSLSCWGEEYPWFVCPSEVKCGHDTCFHSGFPVTGRVVVETKQIFMALEQVWAFFGTGNGRG